MGLLADRAGIQFKILNRSRGPAVWGPRAQCDKALYSRLAGETLRRTANLQLLEGMADEFLVENGRVVGIVTDSGERLLRVVRRRHDRNFSARPHAHGREAHSGRPGRRGRRCRTLLGARAARTAARALQDRHASPGAPRHGRLLPVRAAARRRPAGAVLLPHRKTSRAPGALLAHGDERARPRSRPREPGQEPDVLRLHRRDRPALLPVARRQGRQVRGQAAPLDVSRAGRLGRAGDLHQRSLDFPARRRAAADSPGDPGARARAR